MDLGTKNSRSFPSQKMVVASQEDSFEEKWEIEEEKKSKRLVKFFNFLINFSLLALAVGVPLFFTGLTYQGIAFEKQIYFYFWTLLGLIAWASKCGYLGEMKIRKTPLDIPILAFWLAYLASVIFSVDKWHSVFGFFGDPSRGFLSVTALIIVYYLILSNPSEKLFRWITRGMIFSGSIVIVWSFLASLGIRFLPESVVSHFPVSLLGSIDNATIFLSVFLPIFIFRILALQKSGVVSGKAKFYSLVLLLLVLLDLATLFVLYVYTFWLALLIGLVVLLVFLLSKIVRPKDSWAVFPMAVFVLVLVFLMIGPMDISKANLPYSANVPYDTSFSIAKESLKNNFFLGSGPGMFGVAFSKYLPQGFDNMGIRFYQGEGLILESLSTIGMIGTALLGILILTYLGVSLFLLTRDKENNKLESLGMTSAFLIILVSLLAVKASGIVLIFAFMLGALSLGVIYMESNVKKEFFTFSLKASPKFALTLAFVYLLIFASVAFMFVFIGKIYVADLHMGSVARQEKITESGSITKVMRAININPREGRYYARLGQDYMTLTNEEVLKDESERDLEKIQYYLTLAIQSSKKAEEMMKEDISVVESLAQVYENAGLYVTDAYKLAQEKYARAKELEPNNPDFLIKIGQIKTKLMALEKETTSKEKLLKEAQEDFRRAVDLRKNYSPSYSNLALTQEALGDLDGAVENMTQAFLLQRDNLNYAFSLARIYQSRNKEGDSKIAESLYKQILGVNDKEINTHFNLGTLYEKADKKNEAVAEYQKVVELLPEKSEQAREQLEKMISNIRAGIPNTPENLGLVAPSKSSSEEESSAPAAQEEGSKEVNQ